jgi:hypothetical protein
MRELPANDHGFRRENGPGDFLRNALNTPWHQLRGWRIIAAMKNKTSFSTAGKSVLLAGAALLGLLSFGVSSSRADDHVAVQVNAGVVVNDDFDYYPGYETYYNRTRHEYVYRDNNAWVHRATPPSEVKEDVLLRAPSVRMDFHDSPEAHHDAIAKSYPKNWVKPDEHHDDHR